MVAAMRLCRGGCGAYVSGGSIHCYVCLRTIRRVCERCGAPVQKTARLCPSCRAHQRQVYAYERDPKGCIKCGIEIPAEEYLELRDAGVNGIREPRCRDCAFGGNSRNSGWQKRHDADPVQSLMTRYIAGTDAPCWNCGQRGIISDDLGPRCASCGRAPKAVVEV